MPSMEEILIKLVTNDTSLIREGTKELNEAFKSVESLPALCNLMLSASDPQLRQTAALFLKKRCGKSKHWDPLQEEIKSGIKDSLLKCLTTEQEKFVKRTIADAIGAVIIVEDCRQRTWPELTTLLQQCTVSDNQNDKALGYYTLSILTSIALPENFIQHAGSYTMLFTRALANEKDLSSPITYHIIQCLCNFAAAIGEMPEIKAMYAEALPRVIKAVEVMSKKRPDRAHEAMDLFFDLSDKNKTVDIIRQRLRPIVEMCLNLVRDPTVKMDVQIKALTLVSQLAQTNMQALASMDLMVPVVETVLKLMCEKPDDDDEEMYFSSDSDEETLLTCATATLDEIALNCEADLLMPHIMAFVERGMKGDDPYIHKACYLAVGIVAQGAEECIKYNFCGQLMKLIIRGVVAEHAVVRNAALFALGQFIDFLQPEVNQYAGEIMPILMRLIQEIERLGNTGNPLSAAEKVMFCIQKLVEAMENAATPLLPELVPALLRLSCPPYDPRIREVSLITLEITVSTVKDAITPFFNDIMGVLNQYILQPQTPETAMLQVQSVDTLACVVKYVDREVFERIADDTTKVGMNLLQSTDDPDLRKACYSLFGAMSSVLKERIAPILPTLMNAIIASIKSEEGIINVKDDDDNNSLSCSDDEDDDDDDDDFAVENDFLEEKEVCCVVLKELAENAGESFIPYLEASFVEVTNLLDFQSEDVKRSAVDAAAQLVIAFAQINTPEGQQAANEAIARFVGKATLMVRTEEEKEVVTGVLESFQHLLEEIGKKLDISIKENILLCVKEVAEGKTPCQVDDEDLVIDIDDEEESLIVAAHEVVPIFGKCVSHDEFYSYFKHFAPLFKARCEKDNATSKANMLGTLAECIAPLGPHVLEALDSFIPFFLCMTKHSDHSVRNNSVFFLGVFLLHGGVDASKHYSTVLTALFRLLPEEKDSQVRDNICGALARMILAGTEHVPLPRVIGVLMENLPLKEDFNEDVWVFRALSHLYRRGESVILNCIGHIVKCIAVTLHAHSPDDETKEELVSIVQMTARDFPNEFQEALGQMPPEVVNFLQQACSQRRS